jgi:hypothetical protein
MSWCLSWRSWCADSSLNHEWSKTACFVSRLDACLDALGVRPRVWITNEARLRVLSHVLMLVLMQLVCGRLTHYTLHTGLISLQTNCSLRIFMRPDNFSTRLACMRAFVHRIPLRAAVQHPQSVSNPTLEWTRCSFPARGGKCTRSDTVNQRNYKLRATKAGLKRHLSKIEL